VTTRNEETMNRHVLTVALAVMLAATTGLHAQERQTSMRPYIVQGQQASIRGTAQTLALGFRLAELRFKAELKKLQTVEQWKETKHLVTGGSGRYVQQYRSLEAALAYPALTELAASCTKALESIMRRTEAEETWSVGDAQAYLGNAARTLQALNMHLAQQERAILAFRRQCIRAGDFEVGVIVGPKTLERTKGVLESK